MRKGQVTVYMVLGLIILVVVGGLFYLLSRESEPSDAISTLASQSEDVKSLIESCFEENLLQALYLAGIQGGYIKVPENNVEISQGIKVAYGYFQGEDILVNKDKLSLEVTNYVNFAVEKCADFSKFDSFNIERISDAVSRLEILDDQVVGRLSYPVSVSRGSEVVTYDELYVVNFQIRLGKILDLAKSIVESEKENPNYIDMVKFKESVEETGFNLNILDLGVNENLYVINDEQSLIEGVEYVFQFANKF